MAFGITSAVSIASWAAPAAGQCQGNEAAKLAASDGAAFDFFAYSVAIDGQVAVIGSRWDDDGGEFSGSAHVYRFDGSMWIEQAKLTASDAAEGDAFGRSVAVSGDTAVMGASHSSDQGWATGSAYVFHFDGTRWNQQAKLAASDAAEGDRFGVSVSISGDVIVIGAVRDDDRGVDSGSAYVYRFDGARWNQSAKLTAADGASGDRFGYSLSIDGVALLIGAYLDDDNGADSGSAYVFNFDGANWIQQGKLSALDGADGDHFGFAASISGGAAVIGARFDDDAGLDSGSAYVFRFDGARWNQQAKLVASDGAARHSFGFSASIEGDVLALGARQEFSSGPGAAYLYRFDGRDWIEQARFAASDGAAEDNFGFSIAISGRTALVGAPGDADAGQDSGSAYVFSIATAVDPCDANCDGAVDQLDIQPFLDLLFRTDEPCGPCTGDVNGDGRVDALDIEPFIECVFP